MRGLLDGAGAAAGIDFRDCEYFVGTSAGSIVAAFLAAGREPDSGAEARAARTGRPPKRPARPQTARRRAARSRRRRARPLAARSPRSAARPDRRRPVRAARARLRRPRRRGRPRRRARRRAADEALDARARPARRGVAARFDGRLRIAAVDRRSGRRVVFGAPGSPPATVAQAVLASCSIPWVFAPVRSTGASTSTAASGARRTSTPRPPRRGTEVLCLNPTAALRPLALGLERRRAGGVARAQGPRRAVRTIRPDRAPPRRWA